MAHGAKTELSPPPAPMRKDQVGRKRHEPRPLQRGATEANLCLVLEVLSLRAGCRTRVLRSLLSAPCFLSQCRWYLSIFSLPHMSCPSILA